MKVKKESEKVGLKLNIQKMKIMASGPIISWQIDGETVEAVADFIFLAPKISADGDCSHEIQRRLLLGRKAMTNLDSILRRDITLPTKVCLVKATVFPAVIYEHKSWTIKKAERWRIDAFELWCWRRLLGVPRTARRSNQSILKGGCSLEGLMVKLKLQYFGHLMQRADSFEKTLMLGKIEGRRRRGWQRMRWLDGIDSMGLGLGGLWELVMDRKALQAMVHGVIKSQTRLSDWAELNQTKLGPPGDSSVKNPPADAGGTGDGDSVPGSDDFPGEGHGKPLWYSCLENLMNRGAWRATVHGVKRVRHNLETEHAWMHQTKSDEDMCQI